METNKRFRIVLIGLLVVTTCILVVSKIKSATSTGSQDPGDWVPVLVAERYIPAFTVLKPEMVHVQDFPKGFVPPGALKSKSQLVNENGQMLFTSAVSIPEDQPVTRALVVDASQNDALGSLIRPGKVAVSFEIDKTHGVGGWIRPGDTVALFGLTALSPTHARTFEKKTRLLFPSVIVLAVDDKRLGQDQAKTNSGGDSSGFPDSTLGTAGKIVTVLVSPLEASTIIEAREEGSLSVVLRSLGDDIPWPQGS